MRCLPALLLAIGLAGCVDVFPERPAKTAPTCVPAPEECNGSDEDCDGRIDEDFDINTDPQHCGGCRENCYARSNGVVEWRCVDQVCQVAVCEANRFDRDGRPGNGCEERCAVGVEECNGLDDDCDLRIDEGLTPPFVGGEGICATTPMVCDSGSFASEPPDDADAGEGGPRAPGWYPPDWAEVEGFEATETLCDGIDNDCDGVVDEGDPPPLPLLPGICAGTRAVCNGVDGLGLPDLRTVPGYQAVERTCDGLDNDCDGAIDETFDGQGTPCLTGVGACRRAGAVRCDPEAHALFCESAPAQPAATDGRCDGIDDDCDDRIDEDPPCNGCRVGTAVPEGFVCVPAGTAFIGADDAPDLDYSLIEAPVHQAILTRPFLMSTHEVTQAEWRAVMGTDPSHRAACDDCPVERVSLLDALVFANARSVASRLPQCYALVGCAGTPGAGCLPDDVACLGDFECTDATVDLDCPGWRLPTETEWEYAARAGEWTLWWFGDDPAALPLHAWFVDNSENRPRRVAQKQPNPWGLFDVHGNVGEWVMDRREFYVEHGDPAVDPLFLSPLDPFAVYVARGGTFRSRAGLTRAARRDGDLMIVRRDTVGLRLVRTLPGL
ncbi:MAG: formylglycine-generating enzyme family protein [Myxococcales bacterium]|nr:formylglycine-generating enzyme family protein [Myxococcales bacterium]